MNTVYMRQALKRKKKKVPKRGNANVKPKWREAWNQAIMKHDYSSKEDTISSFVDNERKNVIDISLNNLKNRFHINEGNLLTVLNSDKYTSKFNFKNWASELLPAHIVKTKIYKSKFNLSNKIIYDPTFNISNVSTVFYNKCKNIKSVLLVGNGPIYNDISNTIQDFDLVVRFNKYISENPIDLVGKKTDLHFTCVPSTYSEFKSWDAGCDCIIPFEINFQDRYISLKKINKNNRVHIPDLTVMEHIKNLNCDVTRGYLGLLFFLQLKLNQNSNLNIHIIGFGGNGHHYNKKWKMYHDHKPELFFIDKLKEDGVITDLNEIHE